MFVFDKSSVSKMKEKKTVIESVYRHIETFKNMQKHSSVTLKLVLTAKENRYVEIFSASLIIEPLDAHIAPFALLSVKLVHNSVDDTSACVS